MFNFHNLALSTGVDLNKIDPYASDFDQKVEMANQMVRKWMNDPVNRQYLNEKKADYIHDKGWTYFDGKKGNMKHEIDIPQEAFILLPPEIRNNKKKLMKWANQYHPYLFHKNIV